MIPHDGGNPDCCCCGCEKPYGNEELEVISLRLRLKEATEILKPIYTRAQKDGHLPWAEFLRVEKFLKGA